ncbi:MAG: hypothetical protein Q4F85_14115 [Prevotella sp.]|nr:hypothetical protein [Prevotella sp.]
MKHINKISSAMCTAALGLLMLTGCEGGELYGVDSPDWISEKIDSINNSKNNQGEEVLEGMEEDVYTVGATDFTSGWWAQFSKYYVIPDGKKFHLQFNLNINPNATNTYKNFAMILSNDVDRGGEGYAEYGAIRFDNQPSGNSEWGDYIDRSCVESNLTFGSDTDEGVEKLGGKVTLTVDRSDASSFTVTMTNGTVTKTYKQKTPLANLNADQSNTNMRIFLVPEGSYLNILAANVEPIGGYTSANDKNPISIVLNNVPAKVDAGTALEDAMAGVSATVTFEEGVVKEIPAAELYFSAINDMDVPGDKQLIAIYNKTFKGENSSVPVVATATFKVVPAVASIEVTAMPAQTDYIAYTSPKTAALGFPLNTNGLEITATYINGDKAVLSLGEVQIGAIKPEVGQQQVTITSENGKETTVTVNVTEVKTAADVCPDPAIVGAEDNSTGWWGAHAQDINVPAGKICAWYFTNYGSGLNNWNNWVAILRGAALNEYAVVRADNFGWGAGYDGNADLQLSGGQADWAAWNAAINGGKVAVYVENKGNGFADITAVMQGTNGTNYLQYYRNIIVSSDDLYVSFTVDSSHMVFE